MFKGDTFLGGMQAPRITAFSTFTNIQHFTRNVCNKLSAITAIDMTTCRDWELVSRRQHSSVLHGKCWAGAGTWPLVQKQPNIAHSTADSIFASSNTMSALFPPSSMQVGLPFTAAAAAIFRPVAVLPVNDIFAMPGCSLRCTRILRCYFGLALQDNTEGKAGSSKVLHAPEGCSCIGSKASDDIEYAWRQAHLLCDRCHLQTGKASQF